MLWFQVLCTMATRQNDINVFLPKNICTMAISHILQHHRRIGIQRLRSMDKRLHKRRLFLEELGKALVQPEMMWRKTLPRTAAAKSAVERMRKDAEQSSTSGITDTDTGGKKRARCQLCVSSDNKTSVRCKKCQKYICKDHTQSYCNLCAEEI
ncbi:conserved hypothetical protein [Trichinella spiralis]|uniref:hypothetical protein n=1 Tax=Trichinella spiralis TaxID=6334 RepID=UPI0001EFD1F1|nr:conserved hypothetical protein [Trichinella spiralis]